MSAHPTSSQPPAPAQDQMRSQILEAANQLFARHGFQGTNMKDLARLAGCSVGYLYKFFAGKQELLEAVMARHLDVYQDTRQRVRRNSGLRGLDCLKRELALMCAHLVNHRSLIPVLAERESNASDLGHERFVAMRRDDVALLEEARRRGEVPDLDPGLLAAVIDGASWALIKSLATTNDREVFLSIPDTMETLVFTPMRRQADAIPGKETPLP